MIDLAKINDELQGMSADIQDMEKSFAQSERERWLYSRSLDRIPDLVAEAHLMAEEYKMDYAIVRNHDGVFALCAADADDQSAFIRRINFKKEIKND